MALVTISVSESTLARILAEGEVVGTVDAPVQAPAGSFIARMEALAGPTGERSVNRRGINQRPLAVVNTEKGQRGVFWIGYRRSEPGILKIGTCRLVKGGYLHKQCRSYDGAYFHKASDLALLNS
jgi:hypothetical protein